MQQPQQNQQHLPGSAETQALWQQHLQQQRLQQQQLQQQQLQRQLQQQLQHQYGFPAAISPQEAVLQNDQSLLFLQQLHEQQQMQQNTQHQRHHLQMQQQMHIQQQMQQQQKIQQQRQLLHQQQLQSRHAALQQQEQQQMQALQQQHQQHMERIANPPVSVESHGLPQEQQQLPQAHEPQQLQQKSKRYWHDIVVDTSEKVAPPLGERQVAPDAIDELPAPLSGSAAAAAAAALHPRKTDMRAFLRRLGGRYVTEAGEKEAAVVSELQRLQQELSRVHLLMGKGAPLQQQKDPPKCLCGAPCLEAAVSAAAAGADVAAVLQQQQQLPLHGDTIMSEMATFQDLVSDEHKEKRKGFRNFAGLCKRHVENHAKRRDQRQEELERMGRQQAKVLSGAVSSFWGKVEHIVWEDQKRTLQSQLQQQKEKNFDRFVKRALRVSKAIAGGIRRDGGACGASLDEIASAEQDEIQQPQEQDEQPQQLRPRRRPQSPRGVKEPTRSTNDRKGPDAEEQSSTAARAAADEDDDFDASGEQAEQQEAEDMELDAELEREEDLEGGALDGQDNDEAGDLMKEAEEPLEELLKRYGYASVADFRVKGREAPSSQEESGSSTSSEDEQETAPTEAVATQDDADSSTAGNGEPEAPPEPPSPQEATASSRPRRAASRRVLQQFAEQQKQQQEQEQQKQEEEEESPEGGERLQALIAEREEEDAKLDEEMPSSDSQSDAGADDLANDAEIPLSEVLKSYGFSSMQEFLRRRDRDVSAEQEESESGADSEAEDNSDAAQAHDESQQLKQCKRERPNEESEKTQSSKKYRLGEAVKFEANAALASPRHKLQQKHLQQPQKPEAKPDAQAPGLSSSGNAVPASENLKGKAKKNRQGRSVKYEEQEPPQQQPHQSQQLQPHQPDFKPLPLSRLIRARLREYQAEGVDWLFRLHRAGANCILADEMGLGKTIQTIALLAKMALEMGIWGPHLVVVPTSVLENWEMEFKKFLPGFRVLLYYGSAAERQRKRQGWTRKHAFNVCIVSYATAVKDAAILKRREWYSMVLDEAQNIKNFSSKRWQTLLTFNSQHRLLLTGTPLQNHLLELWSLMHFLMPTLFSSHENFKEWFDSPLTAAIEQSRVQRHQRLVAKLHQVLRPYILRRLKKDVEKQMPSKYEHVIRCELTRRQRCLYDEFLGSRAVQGTLEQQQYRGMMNALMQLRKVCNHPDLFEARPTRTPLGTEEFGTLDRTIPAAVCLWLQEPWCLSPDGVIQRLTGPLTSMLLREAHCSKWAELAAEELSGSLRPLFGSPPAFPESEEAFDISNRSNTDRENEAQAEAFLAAFDLKVLKDPFCLSVKDIPPPTYMPILLNGHQAATMEQAGAEVAAAGAPTQHQAASVPQSGQWTGHDSCDIGIKHLQQDDQHMHNAEAGSTASPGDLTGFASWRSQEEAQQCQQLLQWGPKGLIDGSWFLGGAFGPASIPDISGVMRAKQREMEEAEQPLDDVLPLPLKFLQCQASLELSGDDDLTPQDSGVSTSVGGGVWQLTAAEAAFEGSGIGQGASVPSSRAVRSRWHYLLQGTYDRLTGLPVIPKRLPENGMASAAARAARQRPWCQRQLKDAAASRKAGEAGRFRFLCYLHFMSQLSPGIHLGADGRRFIREMVRRGATYPPFYVYNQIRSTEDYFRLTSYSSSLFPTPPEVCQRLMPLLSVVTCVCWPRVRTQPPRVYLRGAGGQTARASSLHTLGAAAFTLLEGCRLREPILRREHPPTYGLRWGSAHGAQENISTAVDFRAAYTAQLQKGTADDDTGVVLGRHLMHVPACYCVAGSRPALCPENDYYNELLAGPSKPQSFILCPHSEIDSSVRETLARMECIFPPKQLIQDDCGKLIALAELLHKLRGGGHRCIIFTQFSRMLDILESWINYQGFAYLRLDGSTKVENRQRLVNQFNTNPRIFLFISSTRAGGVGINLTGADTVIFYDTDWNPAMDRQAMDRCHRIGQTRDVHIYRLVCAHTIEENIWRKQLQKRLLDEIVVDQGSFTTTNAAKKLGRLEVGDQKGSDLQETEWFSNANTLKELLTAKQEQTEDLYIDRVLHESATETAQASLAPIRGKSSVYELAMDEVEDVEDRAALKQTAKEQKTVQQEMSDDFRDENPDAVDEVTAALNELPALATYCVRFLSDNKSDTLIAQIERFKAQLEGQREEGREGELGGATESASAADGNEVEDTGSETSAAWESELEEEDDADAGEN